jgi:hypothetical protein
VWLVAVVAMRERARTRLLGGQDRSGLGID